MTYSGRGEWIPVLGLFALSLALRLPNAIVPPDSGVYNVDELDLYYSVLGLFGGQTPLTLQWPEGTLTFLLLPLVTAGLFFDLVTNEAVATLAHPSELIGYATLYLGRAYYNPFPMMVTGRALVALLCALTPVLAFILLGNSISRVARFATGVVLATSPQLISETAVLKGDALGVSFGMLALCFLVRFLDEQAPKPFSPIVVACFACLGLAVASRYTYAFLWPALALPVLIKLAKNHQYRRWRNVLLGLFVALTAGIVPILLFVPQVWTNPITTLKAFAGTAIFVASFDTARIARQPWFASFLNMVGLPALLFGVVGAISIWKRKGWLTAGSILLFFLSLFLPLFSSGLSARHYTLVLLPALAMWAGIGVETTVAVSAGRGDRVAGAALASALLVIVAWNSILVLGGFVRLHEPSPQAQLGQWISHNMTSSQRIGLPARLAPLVPPDSSALERIIDNHARRPYSALERVSGLSQRVGLEKVQFKDGQGYVLNQWFGEDERMDLFRYHTMLYAASQGQSPAFVRNAWYYQDGIPEKPDRLATAEVRDLFLAGELDYFVADGAPEAFAPEVARRILCMSRYCVFGRDQIR